MMLMKEIVGIFIRLDTTKWFDRPTSIELFFNKQPTQEQLVEATRHFLTDQEFISSIALDFMKVVKEAGMPSKNNLTKSSTGTIFNETTLFFEVVEEN